MNLVAQRVTSRRTNKIALVIGLFALACFMQTAILRNESRDLQAGDEKISNDSLIEVDVMGSEDSILPRPVMATFYEPVKGGCCGMSEQGHERLLHAWEKGWHDKGWDTRILTAEDAKKHPDFNMVENKLKARGMDEYNRRCYWRWLAMASEDVGGGWMSDYDVVPLSLTAQMGRELSKDGSFKSYGMTVPALIHASRMQWDSVIHQMVKSLPEKKKGFVSDMTSLKALSYWFSGMKISDDLMRRWPYTTNDEGSLLVDCNNVAKFKAVHLSHFGTAQSFKLGHFPEVEVDYGPLDINNVHKALEHRGEAAIQLIKDIHEQCDPATSSIAQTKK